MLVEVSCTEWVHKLLFCSICFHACQPAASPRTTRRRVSTKTREDKRRKNNKREEIEAQLQGRTIQERLATLGVHQTRPTDSMLPGGDFQASELGANMSTVAVLVMSTLTYYMCWRWSESARFHRMAKTGRAGSPSSLPSPIAVLPRWLGFLGGHTLQLDIDKVYARIFPSKFVS